MQIGNSISHYRILEKIGEGGMGVVYKAEDTRLHRPVALKFISPDRFGHSETRTRFEQEACAAASLRHPHINTIYEIDEEDGRAFIAMEYIEGRTLKEKILERPLPLLKAIEITIQVADGLQEAHSRGVIHRDIKSSNIMIDTKGEVRIMDFGLAQAPGQSRMTGTATIMGTVAYMSPEQAACEPIDARSDIWSVGVVLYEMLTGRIPFRGASDQLVLYSLLHQSPEPVTAQRRGIPMELERILEKCLARERGERYQTAADLKADLQRLLKNLAFSRSGVSDPPKKSRWKPIAAAAVVCAVSVAGILLFKYRHNLGLSPGLSNRDSFRLVAVLPVSFSGDEDGIQAVCRGLTAAVTNQLTRLQSLREAIHVIPMRDVIECRADSAGVLGKSLGADLVITGHAAVVEDRFRLMIGISRTDPPREILADRIETSLNDIKSIYDLTMNAVLRMISGILSSQPAPDSLEWPSADPDAVIFYNQGSACLEYAFEDLDKIDRAIDFLQKAVAKDPGFALAFCRLGRAFWEKWFVTKELIWGEMAETNARKALELDPSNCEILTSLGTLLIDRGMADEAGEIIKTALELYPDSANAHSSLAKWHASRGEDSSAEQGYRKAVVLNPVYWGGHYDLALFLYSRGKVDEAGRECRNILNLASDNFEGHVLMGAVHYFKRDIDSAIRSFQASIRIRPNAYAYSNLATIFFFYRSDYHQARDMYLKAIEMGEGKFTVWGNLADAYRQLGETEKAGEAYREAIGIAESVIEIMPRDGATHAKIARYYACLGNAAEAERHIEEARALEASNPRVALIAIQTFLHLDRKDKALVCVEDYLRSGGSVSEIDINPDLEELRKDFRYREILAGFFKK